MAFVKAVRERAKARIGLCGPSGSGKTHSALLLAKGLVPDGKIFVIDSEQGSSCLEAGKPNIPEFLVAEIEKPYTPQKYMALINEAVKDGADCIIIDSLSHAWAGPGGILEMVDRSRGGGNNFTAWRDITPIHNELVNTILTVPCHIIVTMRTKVEWVVEKNDQGKSVPRKVGLSPVQRDGMEYEFTIVFDIDQDKHYARASKDRTSLFDGRLPESLSTSDGARLLDWLSNGAAPAQKPKPEINAAAKNRLATLAVKAGYENLDDALKEMEITGPITMEQATEIANKLKVAIDKKAAA
jgi:energy-coupling factor transporter ATP-binding protein EcfA2